MSLLFLAAFMLQAPDPCYVVAPPGPPRCPNWRQTGHNAQNDSYVDPATLRRDGTGFLIDERLVLAQPLNGTRTAIIRARYDCAARTVQGLELRLYDAEGVLLSRAQPTGAQAAPVPVPPNSPNASVIEVHCRDGRPS